MKVLLSCKFILPLFFTSRFFSTPMNALDFSFWKLFVLLIAAKIWLGNCCNTMVSLHSSVFPIGLQFKGSLWPSVWIFWRSICSFWVAQENFTTVAKTCHNSYVSLDLRWKILDVKIKFCTSFLHRCVSLGTLIASPVRGQKIKRYTN